MRAEFVLDVVEQALRALEPEINALIQADDRGSPYVSIDYYPSLASRPPPDSNKTSAAEPRAIHCLPPRYAHEQN